MAQDLSPILPEKVKVSYPVRICGGSNSPDGGWPKVYEKTINLSDITFADDTITPQPKGAKDTVFVIRDTALALYSAPAGPPTNQAALDDLAKQVATDFYNFRSIAFTKVYNGIIPIPPNGLIDLMEFGYDATEQATRISSQPWGGEPTEHSHQDSSVSMCQDFDRNPGIHVDIPGGASGTSMLGVLSLEDGRLVMTYDQTAMLSCGCTATPTPCASVCISAQSSCSPNPAIDGATVTLTYQGIASIAVTAGGTGYTTPPTVVIATTRGSGGTATAVLTGGVVTSVVVTNPGRYNLAPVISFTGGGGTGATATSTLTGAITAGTCTTTGQVISATVANGGSGYTSIPTASPSGGGGTGATLAVSLGVATAAVVAGGAGYAVNDSLAVAGGTHSVTALLRVTAVAGGVVTGIAVTVAGAYTALPVNPVATTPVTGTGAGATFNLTWKVVSLAVVSGGSGFTSAPAVIFSGGGGSGAIATATIRHQCCIDPGVIGGYSFSVAKTGWTSVSSNFVLTSCVNTPFTVNLNPTVQSLLVRVLVGCHGTVGLAGATVTITGGASITGTTDAAGTFTTPVPVPATFTVAVAPNNARFATPSNVSVDMTNRCFNGEADFTLSNASGYTCGPCSWPLKNTLFLTDPTYGGATLTFGGGNWFGFGGIVATPAFGACPAQAGVQIAYSFAPSGTAGGTFSTTGGACPCGPVVGPCLNPTGSGGATATGVLTCPESGGTFLGTYTFSGGPWTAPVTWTVSE